ncbi:hypothetical protein M231_07748 [Tremella mesenterica]|uniref:Arf-GAP domain-containing protein n=1 Tax=Tremella mesenterica TaxID=5217 RepID=A0A4Q1BBG2_TREME|nr:hypothetical protein M231_07748 [Tremella mesenterica]
MSRQDKATTERHARLLREMVRSPDNKACADCRKNGGYSRVSGHVSPRSASDARWASWNLGVFLCIRCSGVHRSMGTHISKVKSIDLDIWTPEQMEHIQKWGNRRANLYWERHLKAGHVPPEHKIDSFIRSKYESRRWAMDGPPPSDPSILDNAVTSPVTSPPKASPTSTAPAPAPASRAHPLLSRQSKHPAPTPAAAPTLAPVVDLLGASDPLPTSAPAPAQLPATAVGTAAPPPATTNSSIFDLDFHAPSTTSAPAAPKTNKHDIMSLFSATSPTSAPAQTSFFSQPTPNPPNQQDPFASWGGGVTSSAPPQPQFTQTQMPLPAGTWAQPAGWGSTQSSTALSPGVTGLEGQKADPWSSTSDPWATPAPSNGSTMATCVSGGVPKKDDKSDPFANIWQ